MKSKLIYKGEWIKTTVLTNIKKINPQCEICKKINCGPFYYSISRNVVRCKKCFN